MSLQFASRTAPDLPTFDTPHAWYGDDMEKTTLFKLTI